MWKLKPSPRTIKATERYISSLGRKREELTDEQWNLMVTYVQNRRIAIPFLIILGLFCASFAVMYYRLAQGFVEDVLPSQAVKITYEYQRELVSISPAEMQKYLNYAKDCYMKVGMQATITFFFLLFVVGSMTQVRIQNRKSHRILLSRPASTESTTILK